MDLLIDTGNSSIKWINSGSGTLDLMNSVLHENFNNPVILFDSIWGNSQIPDRVLVSNVVGDRFAVPFQEWVKTGWGCPVIFLHSQSEASGVVNGYTEPEKLGVDRWLALIGARSLTQDAVMVIDAGTAITLDIMNNLGQHLGGVIAPGLNMMRSSLIKDTHEISVESFKSEKQVNDIPCPAQNTEDAIYSGTYNAIVGMINQTMNLVRETLPAPVQVLITGGDATQLIPMLDESYQHVPDLVLQGLAKAAGDR
ncbi:MAG: type III pantothenate kinase [Gammaproteobacteria bacterium]|nr:type III pantothenate kinase [Gammaproteobacteria bacterium]MDH5594340.1 type III pantothenate kinase [Gammaproteobacteria bacterium]MDH5614401.1 type III pantothenate kinase [Gammaproteobacteria bacterium]